MLTGFNSLVKISQRLGVINNNIPVNAENFVYYLSRRRRIKYNLFVQGIFYRLESWIYKILYYLCNKIQVNIIKGPVIHTMLGNNGLNLCFLINSYCLSLLNPSKPFNIVSWKYITNTIDFNIFVFYMGNK